MISEVITDSSEEESRLAAVKLSGDLYGDLSGVEAQRAELGAILGLEAPVEERVLVAAVNHPSYASNLLVARGAPDMLAMLLASPPAPSPQPPPTTADLLRHGAEALARWAATGFTTVDPETKRRRLEACEACPHLKSPASQHALLRSLAGTAAGRRNVCSLCGCPVPRKASMASETCPAPHPTEPGLNRWSEPATTAS